MNKRYESNVDDDEDDPDVPSEDPIRFNSAKVLGSYDDRDTFSGFKTNPHWINKVKVSDKSLVNISDFTRENWGDIDEVKDEIMSKSPITTQMMTSPLIKNKEYHNKTEADMSDFKFEGISEFDD